uniref:Protein inturned n=1 Tax=Lygus hesperus TaxID=30085 RepID=A0A146LFZ0_LYGHE
MIDDCRSDWYYDSDSTSSGPASQARSHFDWQSAVDASGNLFFVKRLASRQFSCASSKNNSTFNVNHLHKTPSGFFDKLIRRRSSRRGKNENRNDWDLRATSGDKKVFADPKRASSSPDISSLDASRKISDAHSSATSEPFADYSTAGIIYTTFGELEGSDARNDVIYAFPPLDNILSSARGLFVTLLHLLPSVTSSRPTVTSFWYKDTKINVSYACIGEDTLLLALPDSRFSRMECRRILNELCCYQQFVFQTLSRGYATPIDNFSDLDVFFGSMFRKLDFDSFNSIPERLHGCFPNLVPYLIVPRDIQHQVEEALNELESNEIQSSDDDDRRKFSIIGTAYFYKGYAVCSHLTKDDSLEVFALMRESGIQQYIYEGVKDLVYWKEVYPQSCSRGLVPSPLSPYSTPNGRWFLLIVAVGHNALVTLLESGGCTHRAASHQGPDLIYVEEAQATLRHIIKLGTAHFLSKWIGERENQNEGKYSLGRSSQSLSSFGESLHQGSVKSFELLDYEAAAEDNMPVLGRRAERHLNEISYHSILNLVDTTEEVDSNKEAKNSDHLSESSDMGKRTPGDCVLLSNHRIGGSKSDQYFHYVHLDSSEGIVLSNLFSEPNCPSFLRIVDNFKAQVRQIQDVFRSTVIFQSKSNDIGTTPLNKSMVAIKEYGTLFQMEDEDEKSGSLLYWVTGRLMASPPRELYVCYQDSCPQNLVEIAFHLATTSAR